MFVASFIEIRPRHVQHVMTDGRMDRRTDGRTDGQIIGQPENIKLFTYYC